ncbi:MAG: hypothetical protein AAF664_09575 [Planctomycetota bacterium]
MSYSVTPAIHLKDAYFRGATRLLETLSRVAYGLSEAGVSLVAVTFPPGVSAVAVTLLSAAGSVEVSTLGGGGGEQPMAHTSDSAAIDATNFSFIKISGDSSTAFI